MVPIIRRRRIKNFITFGDQKQKQVVTAFYNKQKQMWDIWLRDDNIELFLTLFAGIALGGMGYTFYGNIGGLLGLLGGFVGSSGAMVFIQPNVKPYSVTLPATAIPGINNITSLSSGTHYYYCPNYDSMGQPLPMENSEYAMLVAENSDLEKQIKLKNERIGNLEAQLQESLKPYDTQMGKRIDELARMSEAARPYRKEQPQPPSAPDWMIPQKEED